jgi:hypothetical protein
MVPHVTPSRTADIVLAAHGALQASIWIGQTLCPFVTVLLALRAL